MLNKILFAGFNIVDGPDFLEFVMRFTLNFLIILFIVRWSYYPTTRRRDYLFGYIIISTLTFLLCYLLEGVKLQIAFALGLFAIFRILRFRTETIPIKEMAYLFLIIGLSVINALPSIKISLPELLFANFAIVLIIFSIEKFWFKHETFKMVRYEKIDLIKAGKKDELIKDLQERTGITKINRVEIIEINFLRDTCDLMIFYSDSNQQKADSLYKNKNENDKQNDYV